METQPININEWLPYADLPLRVNMSWGDTRKAQKDQFGNFWFTDCTHHMQNRYCPQHEIVGWEYEDRRNLEEVLLIKNIYARRKWAEDILKGVRLSFWDRVKLFMRINYGKS